MHPGDKKNSRDMNQNPFEKYRKRNEKAGAADTFKIHCRCVMIKHGFTVAKHQLSLLTHSFRSSICQILFCGESSTYAYSPLFSLAEQQP